MNAWTQPGDLGVSSHEFLNGACVACLYLPDHALENEDAIVASALGVPNELMQIRTLLHKGQGVPKELLEAISTARNIPIERLLPFEGRTVRQLYTEGFCGGALIHLGENFGVGIFVGGMEGVEEEYAMFRRFHPNAAAYPIASTGAAARIIFDRYAKGQTELLGDLRYLSLFRRLLSPRP